MPPFHGDRELILFVRPGQAQVRLEPRLRLAALRSPQTDAGEADDRQRDERRHVRDPDGRQTTPPCKAEVIDAGVIVHLNIQAIDLVLSDIAISLYDVTCLGCRERS